MERLWNKSAIGKKINNNQLLLSSSEVIFCHNHRHLDWPSEEWLGEEIDKNPNLINESIIIEALRVPGNKVMLAKFFEEKEGKCNLETWALRWNSNNHPRKDEPESEVKWFHSSDVIERKKLLMWAEDVIHRGRLAEVLIVDNEQAVVTYNITSENPLGNLLPPSQNILDEIINFKRISIDNGQIFIEYDNEWPCDQIGINYDQGRIIDKISEDLISLNRELWTPEVSVFSDLLARGLHPRPGFKYGTLWRCYDKKIGMDHAPWLIVNPSNQSIDWENACLASRLASGVNKIWLQPVKINEKWNYLGIVRPPANSRWTNPTKK
jgi:hypothetical protein